jgi:hypothetical protein
MLTGMARDELDREDLLREATALVERVELAPATDEAGEHVVIGFRANGAASVYFGGDTAYHFNSDGELRRAYAGGLLFKAEQGALVSLERVRTENEVQLLRRTLSNAQQAEFLAVMQARLHDLAERAGKDALVTIGEVPVGADVRGRALAWLANSQAVRIARSPNTR